MQLNNMELKESLIKTKCIKCGEDFYRNPFNSCSKNWLCNDCKNKIKKQRDEEKKLLKIERLKRKNLEERGFKPYTCESCGKEFLEDYRSDLKSIKKKPPRFCSRSCSNRRAPKEWSDNIKENISLKLKNYYKDIPKEILLKRSKSSRESLREKAIKEGKRILKVCPECGKSFYTNKSTNKVFCSKECYSKNAGGLRPGSGRSKSGWYKGFYCNSTYELCWVIYNIDHNIDFKRCDFHIEYEYKGKTHKYYPDFILGNDKLIEIKGYYQDLVGIKEKAAINNGYNIQVLYKKDLNKEIEYVKSTYHTNDFASLYEKGEIYEYKCEICGKEFKRSYKLSHALCSKKCQGRYSGLKSKEKKSSLKVRKVASIYKRLKSISIYKNSWCEFEKDYSKDPNYYEKFLGKEEITEI